MVTRHRLVFLAELLAVLGTLWGILIVMHFNPLTIITIGQVVSAATLGVGYSLQMPIQNLISGKIVQFREEINPGERITCESYDGTVLALRSFDVLLDCGKGRRHSIPYAKIISEGVTFYTEADQDFDFSAWMAEQSKRNR